MVKVPDKSGGVGRGPSPPPPPSDRRTGARSPLVYPVRCRYESVLDFVETQSMNISRSGMFIMTDSPPPVGTKIDFDFSLSDGFTLLAGSAEVVRVVTSGPVNGMGVRFVDLGPAYRALIERIISVNDSEGRNSTLNFDFSRPATAGSMPVVEGSGPAPAPRPIRFEGRSVSIVLGPATVHHFTQNPLLNVRSSGFFIPAEEDVPLGTLFDVEIVDGVGKKLITGKGKVVAKQDLRVGIRLGEVDKDGMARLRAEVAALEPKK